MDKSSKTDCNLTAYVQVDALSTLNETCKVPCRSQLLTSLKTHAIRSLITGSKARISLCSIVLLSILLLRFADNKWFFSKSFSSRKPFLDEPLAHLVDAIFTIEFDRFRNAITTRFVVYKMERARAPRDYETTELNTILINTLFQS